VGRILIISDELRAGQNATVWKGSVAGDGKLVIEMLLFSGFFAKITPL